MLHNTERQRGFTLIEVLVAATIIAVLTSIGVVSYQVANRRARDAKRKADLEQIRAALEMYKADNAGQYPDYVNELLGWEVSYDGDWLENLPSNYLPQKPVDPKNTTSYYYRYATYPSNPDCRYKIQARMESSTSNQACPLCPGNQGGGEWLCLTAP